MVMTTLEVHKTLAVLERVVAMLEQRRRFLQNDERRLLQRLLARRAALRMLITAREAEREKKVVSFALWRDETLASPPLDPPLDASAI